MRLNIRRGSGPLLQAFLFIGCATAMAQSITVFDVRNAWNLFSFNGQGDVAGSFVDTSVNTSQGKLRGFVRDRSGNFTVFDAPTALWTDARVINGRGSIAGEFGDSAPSKGHNFLRDQNGRFTAFEDPDIGAPYYSHDSSIRAINYAEKLRAISSMSDPLLETP